MKTKFFSGKIIIMLAMILLASLLTYLSTGAKPQVKEVKKEIQILKIEK